MTAYNRKAPMSEQDLTKIESADEAKKVPETETGWNDVDANITEVVPSERINHSYPLKPPQNGTAQPLEPSAAVAAVTVSPNNPAVVVHGSNPCADKGSNPLPSSTSPAGGVPFPLSLLSQEEAYSISSTKSNPDENPPRPSAVNQKYSGAYVNQAYPNEPLRLPPTGEAYKSATQLGKHNPIYSTSHGYQNLWENSRNTTSAVGKKEERRLESDSNCSSSNSNAVSQSYSNKYAQDAVIRHRNNYPKDRTYDYLRRAESQRKSSHSKSDRNNYQKSEVDSQQQSHHHHHHHHHHPNSLGSGNIVYPQTRHKHSDHHKSIARSHEKSDSQNKPTFPSHDKNILKDSSYPKKHDNYYLPNSKYHTSNSDITNSELYRKQNCRNSLNSIHEKWPDSSHQTQCNPKKDPYQYQPPPLNFDKKQADLKDYAYHKWNEDPNKYNHQFQPSSIKKPEEHKTTKSSITEQHHQKERQEKQFHNWYNSAYSYNSRVSSDDTSFHTKTKHQISRHYQQDYIQKPQWNETDKKYSNGPIQPTVKSVTPDTNDKLPFANEKNLYPTAESLHAKSSTRNSQSPIIDITTVTSAEYPTPVEPSSSSIYSTSRDSLKLSWSSTKTSAISTISNLQAPIEVGEVASSRGRHNSHSSNSSASSLSQLSQPFPLNNTETGSTTWFPPKETGNGERAASSGSTNHSRSNSRNVTPSTANPGVIPTSISPPVSSSSSFETSGSLTSLVFSKPSTWTTPTSSQQQQSSSSGSGLRPSTSPLATNLHLQSIFSPSPSSLLSGSGHQVMFAPSLVPPASFLPPPPASTANPVFPQDSLFAPTNQDLLRRELDTRFLASHDRSINIPPPPYMRTEMHQHQHQHTHMHQHTPFLPPPLGAPLMPQGAAHLYDKFPKLDSSFYARSSLGLPGYPGLSPFLAPNAAAAAAATPFGPPGHLAAFQPKANSLIKTKQMKSGRWCAMHVRIAWEIYRHQQKQQQSEPHKAGANSSGSSLAGNNKSPPELLHPSTALFTSLPKPHDLTFSSSLFGAANRLSSLHPRSPYEVASPHGSFLSPSGHLGMSPLVRPTYPTFGTPGGSFGGLGSLAGLGASSLFGGKEMAAGMLPQDPWTRLHRTPPSAFPSPSASNSSGSSSWGGLKAEAERERLQHRTEEPDKERHKRPPAADKERKDSDKPKEVSREKKEQEKQKERDREARSHHQVPNSTDVLYNGEFGERRERDKSWDRSRERRDRSRSPVHVTAGPKLDGSAFDNKSKQDNVKVKEEKKDGQEQNQESLDRTKNSESAGSNSNSSSGSSDRTRVPGPERSPLPPQFWSPLPPGPVMPIGGPSSSSLAMSEHYRNLELHHMREMDREHMMHKYNALPDRLREVELARHSAYEAERERALYERKLIPPPPMRTDMTFVPPLGLPPPTTTHSSGSGLFPFSNSFLSSFCGTSSSQDKLAVTGNGIPPPPLIPCGNAGNLPTSLPSNSKSPSPVKTTADSPQEAFVAKEKRESTTQPREVESQSR